MPVVGQVEPEPTAATGMKSPSMIEPRPAKWNLLWREEGRRQAGRAQRRSPDSGTHQSSSRTPPLAQLTLTPPPCLASRTAEISSSVYVAVSEGTMPASASQSYEGSVLASDTALLKKVTASACG